jgi:hypothetical protein
VTLFAYKYRNELTVLASVRVEQDGKRWLHVSCAGQDTIPSWAELKDIKNMFMGKNVVALQVLPASDKYINLHPNVLHLWHCLDGDVTPDFAHEGLI